MKLGDLRKVAYAGAQSSSFVNATKDLEALGEVAVTAKRIEHWTKRVGDERTAEAHARGFSAAQSVCDRRRGE